MLYLVREDDHKRDFLLRIFGPWYVNQVVEGNLSGRVIEEVFFHISRPNPAAHDGNMNARKLSVLSLQPLRIIIVKIAEQPERRKLRKLLQHLVAPRSQFGPELGRRELEVRG